VASSDAIELLDRAVRGFLDEVPALKDLRLVVGVDLNGRGGDVQQFRIDMPELDIRKDMGTDAKIRIEMRRDFFNLMVEHGAKVPDWEQAFYEGRAKATGVDQYLKLIQRVVERQQERARLKRARG
jgi:hypothetical protein